MAMELIRHERSRGHVRTRQHTHVPLAPHTAHSTDRSTWPVALDGGQSGGRSRTHATASVSCGWATRAMAVQWLITRIPHVPRHTAPERTVKRNQCKEWPQASAQTSPVCLATRTAPLPGHRGRATSAER
eukprot:2517771-Prymnesium_polylepis.1